jgi:hypothetical protein
MGNPLFGRYDKDPGRFRSQFYKVEVDVPVTLGGAGRASVALNNEPFVLTRITAKIIGDTNDPSSTGLYQDGQFDIEWKDEQRTYVNSPMAADLMFGSNVSGYILELPMPIPYAGNKTLSFTVYNRIARTLVPASDNFTVQIVLAGISDLGELQYT